MVGETRIADARDLGMFREVTGDGESALALAPDTEHDRAHAADRKPCFVRGQVRTVENGAIAHRASQLFGAPDGAAHDIAVAVQIFGERMDDHRRAERRRTEEHRRREGRVHCETRAVIAC